MILQCGEPERKAHAPDPVKLLNGATGRGVGNELIRALVENLYSGTLDQLDHQLENSDYGTYEDNTNDHIRFSTEEVNMHSYVWQSNASLLNP